MVGRKHECSELNRLYDGKRAELIAIYGRRRVGKTFLVDEAFAGRITFRHAGLAPTDEHSANLLRDQLDHFYNSLLLHGMERCDKPSTWLDAFFLLEKFLQGIDNGTRQLVFLDELPWLDTPRSGFLRAFEGFWNTWGCHRKNLMVVVCGSAPSWIANKLINNHGGLYNRVTYEIKLSPFTLRECEEFYDDADVRLSRYDIAQSYMVFGGIPYYLGYMEPTLSLAQNIDKLFFDSGAPLRDEFDRLFNSVFASPEIKKSIVRLLHTRNAGFTRKEITQKLGISDGGRLTNHLNALLASDFIVRYVPFGMSKRAEHYKLVDPFCLFYLRFVSGARNIGPHFWQQNTLSQPVVTWRGLAFENVCFNHVDQIKAALGVLGVISTSSTWSKRADDETGAQIDLLISRNDNVVNMCEIKYYGGDFAVDKDYYKVLLGRQQLLMKSVSAKMTIHSTLITTFGLKHNEYANAFTNVVILDDLFRF
jgi:AAA+ ATPase superfamily predicted ATPase